MTVPKITRLAFLTGSLALAPAASQAGQIGNFIYSDDGTSITITGNTFVGTKPVVIPAIIDGKPVRTIGPRAFAFSHIGGVTIPSGVTRIGELAFGYIDNLTTVKFPPSVTRIGDYAFAGFENFERGLSSVIFTGNAPNIGHEPFQNAAPGFKIFVEKDGPTGFTVPRWNGYKVSRPAPEIEIFGPEVPLYNYFKSAYFDSGVSSLKFRNVLIGGNSEWKTLLIRNVGSRSLSGLKLKIVGASPRDFAVKGLDRNQLKPGGVAVLKVRFKPLSHHLRTAELCITSNDGDESQFIVPLRGRGLKALE
ncbi:MAG: leucine-rich repeat protein [Verrucomicrobiota bacterium]